MNPSKDTYNSNDQPGWIATHLDDIDKNVFDDTSFDETLMSTLDIWESDFLYTRVVSLWSNIE